VNIINAVVLSEVNWEPDLDSATVLRPKSRVHRSNWQVKYIGSSGNSVDRQSTRFSPFSLSAK
jgi:hypothetical protein